LFLPSVSVHFFQPGGAVPLFVSAWWSFYLFQPGGAFICFSLVELSLYLFQPGGVVPFICFSLV
jgi:hypothetical protein